mmetsp:Transcript_80998/g.216256  ORF Transcript_80998/g.216256 Transcript_80998/m.216256 type:complete len:103 (-) Transcript_80998:27-335(-)
MASVFMVRRALRVAHRLAASSDMSADLVDLEAGELTECEKNILRLEAPSARPWLFNQNASPNVNPVCLCSLLCPTVTVHAMTLRSQEDQRSRSAEELQNKAA